MIKHRTNMFSTTASVAPFQWKEPVPSKDYMRENYQHIRKLEQSSKKPKSDGLKPKFIPGVTKNPKYDHVHSRVAEFLKPGGDGRIILGKTQSIPSSSSSTHSRVGVVPVKPITAFRTRSSEKPSLATAESLKPIWGASIAANAKRLSKSSTDLTQKQKATTPSRTHSLRRRQPLQLQDESVYNWRFSESLPRSVESQVDSRIPPDRFSHSHRVEYLPCDGICAEEAFPGKDEQLKEDSARSSSSSRTSRGVNTEETRIFQDPAFRKPFIHAQENRNVPHQFGSNGDFSDGGRRKINVGHDRPDREDSGIEKDFSNLALEGNDPRQESTTSRSTNTKINQTQSTNLHRPGIVPGYLKQRKQQWKDEAEAKKEAERNADVPPGHVLMSDAERVETLRTVKENYDGLIAELNRIPVGRDTVRVRDEKKKIEDRLTKLEQAVKIFSRPRVFVKMDQ